MAQTLFTQAGTLVGAPVDIDIQVLTGALTPAYLEVSNLSAASTYTCALLSGPATVSFSIPPGRKLGIPGPVAKVTLNGTGNYIVNGGPSKAELPSLDNSSQGAVGSTISPPDGVTIEDTGLVIQVKDLGISTAKLANQAATTAKIADAAITTAKLSDFSVTFDKVLTGAQALIGLPDGINIAFVAQPAVGNTVRIVYGTSDATYTFVAAPGAPTDVVIGAAASDTANNLVAAIGAVQLTLIADAYNLSTQPVVGVVGAATTDVQTGFVFAVTIVAPNLSLFQMTVVSAETKTGCFVNSFVVDAVLTGADAVFVPFGYSIISWIVSVRDNTGTQKYWTGMSALALGTTAIVLDDGGATPWAIGDTVTVLAFGTT